MNSAEQAQVVWPLQICWPFNTYIQPGDNYTLDLQAEDVVLQAIDLNVTDNGTLQLSTDGDFQSPYPIVAIVRSLSS